MANLDDDAINQFNGNMRQQPWYQQWFAQRGLNPDRVKLNDRQQGELEQTMRANGMPVVEGTHVDPAGNLNTKHGWAGLPTWAKVAIVAAATVGTAGAAGVFTSGTIGSILSKKAIDTTSDATSDATAAGFGLKDILGATVGPGIGLATNYFAGRAATSAQERSEQARTDAANRAAELEREAAAAQLAWLKEQEARRQMEWQTGQDRNFDIWNKEMEYRKQQDALTRQQQDQARLLAEQTAGQVEAQRAFERQQQEARVGRLKPFVDFGTGSLGQLSYAPGTVGASMKKAA